MELPKLGHHVEICFSVEDIGKAVEYYQQLGFDIYTGGKDKGWCTIYNGQIYLSLHSKDFIDNEFDHPFLINFRGGNIEKISEALDRQGITFEKQNVKEGGIGNLLFRDPDGIPIFIDTAEEEDRVDIP